jgi:two-component system response regulator AtoC
MDAGRATVLVVDDDAHVRGVVEALLRQDGFATEAGSSGEEAVQILGRRPVDVIISDIRMPGIDGLGLLQAVQSRFPEIPVILMTAHGTIPVAVEAMRKGAADFLLKPFDRDELLYSVRKAFAGAGRSRAEPPPGPRESELLGESPAMRAIKADLGRVADTTATVLLRGESGTGKELAARMLHQRSRRRERPFVKVLCAALPDTLLESELFGYEKGAFTGAANRKPGRVELAEGGTLFLDEIGDIDAAAQVKLLRLLAERTYERLGGTQTLTADVRIVTATHRPLEEMVRAGKFRADLFYRLNVVPIRMPGLRERGDDVARLLHHFCAALGAAHGRPFALHPEAEALLLAQEWPGNVRELQSFVERLLLLSQGPGIERADVERELARQRQYQAPLSATGSVDALERTDRTPGDGLLPASRPEQPAPGLGARLGEAGRAAVLDALGRAKGNRSLAARLLGVSRRTLYNKLSEYGVG